MFNMFKILRVLTNEIEKHTAYELYCVVYIHSLIYNGIINLDIYM